jgi:nanoRNase/pAp phosphatase (c-di-AMP/oligoRNAs hydrolase)
MINQSQASQIQSAFTSAQTIFIVLPQNANFDKVSAGLGLYLSLLKANKMVSIASPTRMTVRFSSLVGVNKIKNRFQGSKKDLIVSFDYVEEAIEKVSYNIENGKFNLVIKPKPGYPPLESEKVKYSYSGGSADLILTVGVRALEDLGNLFKENKDLFKESQIINIDSSAKNQQYGQINLVDPATASISEQVVELIGQLRLPTDGDISSNLLLGIEQATNQFNSVKVSPATFEAAAFCLKMGARRRIGKPLEAKPRKTGPPLRPMPAKISAQKIPSKAEEEKEEKPSPDWLQPKIYKGNTRL